MSVVQFSEKKNYKLSQITVFACLVMSLKTVRISSSPSSRKALFSRKKIEESVKVNHQITQLISTTKTPPIGFYLKSTEHS